MRYRIAVLAIVVLAIVFLQEWASRPSYPFDAVKSIRLRYGANSDIEVVVIGKQAINLIGTPREAVGVGKCRCTRQREFVLERENDQFQGNICEHGVSIEIERGFLFFEMPREFQKAYQAGCDSVYFPVPGKTAMDLSPGCEAHLRTVYKLLRDKMRRYGAPSQVSSQDCEHYSLRFPDKYAPAILGDHCVGVNVNTGKVHWAPRM